MTSNEGFLVLHFVYISYALDKIRLRFAQTFPYTFSNFTLPKPFVWATLKVYRLRYSVVNYCSYIVCHTCKQCRVFLPLFCIYILCRLYFQCVKSLHELAVDNYGRGGGDGGNSAPSVDV